MAGTDTYKTFIRITDMPPGDAPEWVRQKWIGLELPLSPRLKKSHNFIARGVLQPKRNFLYVLILALLGKAKRSKGYAVPVLEAVKVLEKSHPDAAAWWKENTPNLVQRGKFFVFHEECCETLEKEDVA